MRYCTNNFRDAFDKDEYAEMKADSMDQLKVRNKHISFFFLRNSLL